MGGAQARASTKQFAWSTAGSLPLLLDDSDHSYIYGPSSTPIAQVDDTSGAIEYLHADALGTPRAITNSAGAVTGTQSFDAYGTQTASSGAASTVFGFTGNLTDAITGLLYLRARDYDPATGQFLTVDPALDSTHQPYAYAGNDPVLNTDPTGLCPVNGGANVPDCTSADFGGTPFLLTPAMLALGDALRPAQSSLAGLGDGASGGLTEMLREANGTNCQINKDGFYWVEFGFGFVGSFLIGTGEVRLGLEAISNAGKVGKVFEGVASSLKLTKPAHGNSAASGATAYLYRLETLAGKYLKTGISQNPLTRYNQKFMVGKKMRILTEGARSEILKLERFIVERDPGPKNREPWAGIFGEDVP